MSELTQSQVASMFKYDKGNLYWTIGSSKNVKAGDLAGGIDNKGRRRVCIKRKSYQAHRIIFLLCNGYLPKMIDHIDGNPLNNLIENLRPTDFSTNGYNRKIGSNNTSGVKGLVWNKPQNKWQAFIKVNGQTKYFGYYKYKEIGSIVIEMARQKFHGQFMRIA